MDEALELLRLTTNALSHTVREISGDKSFPEDIMMIALDKSVADVRKFLDQHKKVEVPK